MSSRVGRSSGAVQPGASPTIAYALELARRGARVVVNDVATPHHVVDVSEECPITHEILSAGGGHFARVRGRGHAPLP